jgi:hypothetical protein
MVLYDFLKVLPQLVCQTSHSNATLNQLLGTCETKALKKKKLQLPHSHPNSLPSKEEEGKQTGMLVLRDAGPWVQQSAFYKIHPKQPATQGRD